MISALEKTPSPSGVNYYTVSRKKRETLFLTNSDNSRAIVTLFYSGNKSELMYCVIAFREFSILCSIVFVCMLMSGLRLSDLNKETTYLLT